MYMHNATAREELDPVNSVDDYEHRGEKESNCEASPVLSDPHGCGLCRSDPSLTFGLDLV